MTIHLDKLTETDYKSIADKFQRKADFYKEMKEEVQRFLNKDYNSQQSIGSPSLTVDSIQEYNERYYSRCDTGELEYLPPKIKNEQ